MMERSRIEANGCTHNHMTETRGRSTGWCAITRPARFACAIGRNALSYVFLRLCMRQALAPPPYYDEITHAGQDAPPPFQPDAEHHRRARRSRDVRRRRMLADL
ncbi:protein of unknown function [Burkholderia multivorans]